MITEPFLICENPKSMPGPGLVLSTSCPYWIGKVVNFKNQQEFDNWKEKNRRQAYIVDGYRIVIILFETLAENDYEDNYADFIVKRMAEFYLKEKIKKNEGYYRRYKID